MMGTMFGLEIQEEITILLTILHLKKVKKNSGNFPGRIWQLEIYLLLLIILQTKLDSQLLITWDIVKEQ